MSCVSRINYIITYVCMGFCTQGIGTVYSSSPTLSQLPLHPVSRMIKVLSDKTNNFNGHEKWGAREEKDSNDR